LLEIEQYIGHPLPVSKVDRELLIEPQPRAREPRPGRRSQDAKRPRGKPRTSTPQRRQPAKVPKQGAADRTASVATNPAAPPAASIDRVRPVSTIPAVPPVSPNRAASCDGPAVPDTPPQTAKPQPAAPRTTRADIPAVG
jgi:hypothetical protein